MSLLDQSATILGVVTCTLVLSGIFVFLRTYTRFFANRGAFGWDDALIIVTWFTVLAFSVCVFVAVHNGYGRPSQDLSAEPLVQATKFEIISQVLAMFSYPTGKASVAILITRAFSTRLVRWSLWITIIANVLVWYSSGLTLLVRCTPVSKSWNMAEPGHCFSREIPWYQAIIAGAIGTASNFLLTCIPLLFITKLQTNYREKLAIGFVLSLGVFAGISSILKTIYTSHIHDETDLPYSSIPSLLWTSAELCTINIAACIPTLGPLFQQVTQSTNPTTTAHTTTLKKPPNFSSPSGKRLYRVQINAGGSSISDRKDSSTKSLITPCETLSSVDLDRHILVEQSFRVQRASEIESGGSLYDWRDSVGANARRDSKAEQRVDEVEDVSS